MTIHLTPPLVTVVIPCYNHEQYVQDTIKSVIEQTYTNIELIIIDDGSKDGSVAKIQALVADCQQRFARFEFRHRANKGLCNTLNEALEWANGEYFCTLASDDQILPEKITLQTEYLNNNPQCVAVFGAMQFIDEHNNRKESRIKEFRKFTFKEILLHKHELPAPSQLIRKSALDQTEKYNPELKIEDWDMWLKLSKLGSLDYLPIVLCLYRIHTHNTISNFELMSSNRLKIINQYQEHPSYPKAWRNVKLMEHEYHYGRKEYKKAFEIYIMILKKYPLIFIRFKLLKRLISLYINQLAARS